MDVFSSKNAVIMSYFPFSGGKFLGNCLSLSKDFCPQDPLAAEYLLQNPTDYDYRLQVVLKTLPPPDKMHLWQTFEHGDERLYGSSVYWDAWSEGIKGTPNDITKKLCDSKMRFLLTEHTMEPFGLCKVWPNATLIRLVNFRNFQDICLRKKRPFPPRYNPPRFLRYYCMENYNRLRGPDWPDWEEFQQCGYDVKKCHALDQATIKKIGRIYRVHLLQNQVIIYDVDQSYFDADAFINSMRRLYEKFGLTDFSADLISFFYKKYISLHF